MVCHELWSPWEQPPLAWQVSKNMPAVWTWCLLVFSVQVPSPSLSKLVIPESEQRKLYILPVPCLFPRRTIIQAIIFCLTLFLETVNIYFLLLPFCLLHSSVISNRYPSIMAGCKRLRPTNSLLWEWHYENCMKAYVFERTDWLYNIGQKKQKQKQRGKRKERIMFS